ncbi:hypothetical protein V8E52_010508 [Russula decolorans]
MTFLTKHHINNKLQVTDCRCYICKMQVPPSNKRDACNVENFMEYQDMVRRVLERRPTRAITIFVDMKDVDCAAKKAQKDVSRDSEDESDDEGQSDVGSAFRTGLDQSQPNFQSPKIVCNIVKRSVVHSFSVPTQVLILASSAAAANGINSPQPHPLTVSHLPPPGFEQRPQKNPNGTLGAHEMRGGPTWQPPLRILPASEA